MKKRGPDFARQPIEVQRCRNCRGAGSVKGVFYELPCDDCNGVGWTAFGGALAPAAEMAFALGRRLDMAERQLTERIQISRLSGTASGPADDNTKGPGGAHYRGD